MSAILIAGALANKYRNGGGTWERMSWVVGLQRLGFEVYFVEQIARESCVDAAGAVTSFEDSVNLAWFRSVTQWFGVADRAALIYDGGQQWAGIDSRLLADVADSAELLVNLSGHLTFKPLIERIRRSAYIDVDPGFTQIWHADPNTPFRVAKHDDYFTIGENIGSSGCSIPTGNVYWRTTRQPVVLEDWPAVFARELGCFTTIANWRGPYGPIFHQGKTLGLKVHEFRKFARIPRLVPQPFEIALNIHPADEQDRQMLLGHGWKLVDPLPVTADPDAMRRYIQSSGAEFSVAQGVYVDTQCGWFSDRSVRYLASGKPVLVQDTGLAPRLPVGEGLLVFRNLEDAVAGAEAIRDDYPRHCAAARRIAEEYFDSDKVLGKLVDELGITP